MPFDANAFLADTFGPPGGGGLPVSRPAARQPPQQSSLGAELEAAARNYVATFGHIAGALGIDAAREWAREQEEKAAQAAARSGFTQSFRDVDLSRPSTLASYIGHLGIQSLPYAAEALAAALTLGGSEAALTAGRLGLRAIGREATEGAARAAGRTAAAVAGSIPSSVGTILSAQQEQAGRYDLPSAAALGVPFAGLNVFGLEGAIARGALPAIRAEGRLARAVGTGLRAGASESVSETGQQALEEVGRQAVDPTHDIAGEAARERFLEAAIGGLALGGAVGGARGVVSGRPEPVQPISDTQPTDLLRGGRPQPQPAAEQPAPPTFADISLPAPPEPTMADLVAPTEVAGVADPMAGFRGESGLAPAPQPPAPVPPFGQIVDPMAGFRGEDGTPLGAFRASPPGTQGDLLAPGGVSPEQPAPTSEERRAEIREEVNRVLDAQRDLFEDHPAALVATDFSLRHLRQRILAATQGRQDAYTLQIAARVARALAEGKPEQAAAFLAAEQQKLETAKVTPATIEHRLRALVAAERAVEDYTLRLEDARRQETAAAAERGRARAQPGVVVDRAPPADTSATVEQMRERNAARAAEPPAEQRPAAPTPNVPEDIEATVANEARERIERDRRRILQEVLDDPATVNPVGRFRAALKKAGYRTTALTEAEAATIERFEAAREAFTRRPPEPEAERPIPDRSGGARPLEEHIPERRPKQRQQPKEPPRRRPLYLSMEKRQELPVPPVARPEPAPAPDTGTIPDARQISMFRGRTRAFTPTAVGETRARLLAEADRLLAEITGARSKEVMAVAVRAFREREVDMAFVRDVAALLRERKIAKARTMVQALERRQQAVDGTTERRVADADGVSEPERTAAPAEARPAEGAAAGEATREAAPAAAPAEAPVAAPNRETQRFREQLAAARGRLFAGRADRGPFDPAADALARGAVRVSAKEFIEDLPNASGQVAAALMPDGALHRFNSEYGREGEWRGKGAHARFASEAGDISYARITAFGDQVALYSPDPLTPRQVQVVRQLEALGRRAGVSVEVDAPTPSAPPAPPQEPPTADPEVNTLLRLVDERNQAVARQDRKAVQAIDAAIDAQRRKITAAAPAPVRHTLTPEEVRERLMRDRAARQQAGGPGIRTEITQAQAQRRITPQQAANLRETLREEGEQAAREQLRGYLEQAPTARVAGTARDLSSMPVNDRTVPVEAREEGPAELDFEPERGRVAPRLEEGSAEPAGGMAPQEVERIVADLTARWRGAPPITVVARGVDLPAEFSDMADSYGFFAEDDQGGGRDRIYLIAENMRSRADVVATLYHETLGHYGLRTALRDRLDEVLEAIYRTNSTLRARADAYLKRFPDVYTGEDRRARAVEEALSYMVERGEVIAPTIMERIKAVILQFARRIGLYSGAFSDAEVLAILDRARREVERGPGPGPRGPGRGVAPRRDAPDLASPTGLQAVTLARDRLTDVRGVGRRLRLASLFQRNLEELYGDRLPTLRAYNRLLFQSAAKVNRLTSDAHDLLDRWNRLAGAGDRTAEDVQQELGALALEATFHQIRPDLPLDHEANSQVTSDPDKARYEEMRRRFAALPRPAQDLYREIFDKFEQNLQAKRELFKQQIRQSDGLDEETKRKSEREIDEWFKRIKVYFPLMRFGDHIVIARSDRFAQAEARVEDLRAEVERMEQAGEPGVEATRQALRDAMVERDQAREDEGYVVRAFERESDAKREARRLREAGFVVTERLAHDYQPEVDGVSAGFLTRIREALDAMGAGDAQRAAIAREMKTLFTQAYFQSLPEHHALKAHLKRAFVRGFSEDAKRAFAAAMVRDAHYLAKLEFGQKTRDALEEMRREARAADQEAQDANPDAPKLAQEVFEEVAKRHAAALRYTETPVQDLVANVGYLWFLGFTPSFMVLNTLQVPLVTLPMMASRYGLTKAGSALATAARQVGRAQISVWRADGPFGEIDPDTLAVDPDERAMLQRLLDSGIIDLTQEHDLGTISRGGNTRWRALMRVASFLPHYTEKANRLATALAAYRLAREEKQRNPGARLDPVAYAEKVVADSHFDYSAENAPRWMRPSAFPLAKVMFQFRKYQLGMAYAITNSFWQAIRNADPQERRLAKRTFLGLLLSHGLAAGTLGLPGVALVAGAANLLHDVFGDDDEPWDAEAAYRNFLVDIFGGLTDDPELARQMGEIVARGAFRAPGVRDALPGDLSQRVGLQDLFSPVRLRRGNKEGRDQWHEILAASFGPAASIGGDLFEATRYFSQGDYAKGVEIALPKAVRDLLRAHRFGTEGVTTSKGNVVMGPDQIPLAELVAQALGFTPARISEQYEARGAIEEARDQLARRRQALLRSYAEARRAGDEDGVVDAMAAIQRYNTARRARGEPIIRPTDMLRAVRERQRFERELVHGARLRRTERALADYARFAAP